MEESLQNIVFPVETKELEEIIDDSAEKGLQDYSYANIIIILSYVNSYLHRNFIYFRSMVYFLSDNLAFENHLQHLKVWL